LSKWLIIGDLPQLLHHAGVGGHSHIIMRKARGGINRMMGLFHSGAKLAGCLFQWASCQYDKSLCPVFCFKFTLL